MKTKTLDNGLVILYEKNAVNNKDAFQVNVLTGSALEGPKEKGINHLVEHLMFKASFERTTKQISEELEQQGAIINAWTNYDNVCFHFECLPDKLEKCAEIYADMLLNKNLNKKEFEKEKSVVCQEIAMYEDDFEATNETNYYREFLGMDDVAGSIKSVKAITLKQVNDFIINTYIPKNMVISVCSHLSFRKVCKIVEKYFDEYASTGKDMRTIWDNTKIDLDIKKKSPYKQKKDTAQVQVLHAYYMPDMIATQRMLDLYENVLSAGLSAVLFREVREKYGVCYSIHAEFVTLFPHTFNDRLPQILLIKSSTEKKHLKQYLEAVDKVITNLPKIITDKDVERAVNFAGTIGLKSTDIAKDNFFRYCNPMYNPCDCNVTKENKLVKKSAKQIVHDITNRLFVADCDISILGNI
ncbi:MAG: insulinase family protein [Bacilli bacterium]|nr:insulinase family protein [Bacilli bacterium]